MFKKPGHLKNHWAHTNHEAFTQLKNDGHAISNNDCNKHFKELIFPILTHTRALPRFYFTQHHTKLDKETLHTDLKFIQVLYNMFTRAFFALPKQIIEMCNNIFGTEVTLPLLPQQRTHIHTAISNLSWGIPELQELLLFQLPEDSIHISDHATQESHYESSDLHDTYHLSRTESDKSETDEVIETSTPINTNHHVPPNMDETVIPNNPHE